MLKVLGLILVILTLVSGLCGQSSTVANTINTPVPGAAETLPNSTPAPPTPTDTPEAPTVTPTPEPTATPAIFSGSGDSIVDVSKSDAPMIAIIQGNDESGYFGVTTLNTNNEQVDLLINTTDPYLGVVPIDFQTGELTTRFEVKATGGWRIDLLPLTSAEKLSVPGQFIGSNDNVLILEGVPPDVATITGNADSRYFGVFGYGSYSDILINTTDPYQGQVILKPDTLVLVIRASGEWTIAVTGK